MARSLRARLVTGLVLIAVVLVGLAAVTTLATRHRLIDQVDAQLQAAANGQPPPRSHDPQGQRNDPVTGRSDRLSALFVGLIGGDGELLPTYSSDLTGNSLPIPDITHLDRSSQRAISTVDSIDQTIRYRIIYLPGPTGDSVQALPLTDVDAAVSQILLVESLGLLIVLALLGAVAWWVIHLGLRPIAEITAAARDIASGDPTAQVTILAPVGTEAGDLANALRIMLSRLEDSADAQEASEARLRRFVADASHELRTPITTIRGYADLYRLGGLDERDDLDDAMRRTGEESERVGRLVEDMLTLAKLDEGRPLGRTNVDISKVMRDAALDASVSAPERTIESQITPKIMVTGDDDRLRQVVANLVTNALVHTPIDARVRLEARTEAESAIMEVSDNGPGMPEDVASRATERFYRADGSRSRNQGGSGLGLAIVESMVQDHGGTVEVDSSLGLGTTVRLILPLSLNGTPASA